MPWVCGKFFKLVAIAIVLALAAPSAGEARVGRFIVEQTRLFAGGMAFGNVGPYERLDGTAYMEVDPRHPANAGIVNLDKAPRNARGMVEFSSPFFILKPVDVTRGNHKFLFGINNRGNKIEMARFNFVRAGLNLNDPLTAADAGDGFLMRLGYAFVDAGWQGDVAPGNNRLVPSFPIARQADGSPIVAAMRVEYSDRNLPPGGTFTLPLEGSAAFRSYEAADTNTAHSTLTVRDSVNGPKVPIRPDRWAFGRCPMGPASLVPSTFDICLFGGFRFDMLYELIYPAKNPIVMGLGHAVTRDIASFLRNATHDDAGNPNPLALSAASTGIRRAYASGSSQTGGYLRDFVFLGFNEDESHRKVFDAINISIAGTDRVFINVEFADPNVYSAQEDRHDFLQTSYPPLTYAVTTDPISGIREGVLKRPATDPLVIDTHHETEYYQLRASLNLTDGLGRPVPIPDTVRLYYFAGFQHGAITVPLAFPGPSGICLNVTNPNYEGATMRALLMAMDAWANQGVKPPKSRVPDVRNGTLVSLDDARAAFPAIPGVEFPPVLNGLELLDFGPEFGPEGGRLSILPPLVGPSYMVLVPKPDKDGVSIAGVRQVEIAAPLGTNTGWNTRAPGFREGNLCRLSGSYIPFATTKAERLAAGDPRKSLEERYRTHAGYVKAVERAAKRLVRQGFLLEEDADRIKQEAKARDLGLPPGRPSDDDDDSDDD